MILICFLETSWDIQFVCGSAGGLSVKQYHLEPPPLLRKYFISQDNLFDSSLTSQISYMDLSTTLKNILF